MDKSFCHTCAIQDRKYVTVKSRVLHPEFRGRMVSAFLSHLFSEIVDYSFTANMETELDNISAGSTEWKGLLKDYWERLSKYCGDASQWDVRKVIFFVWFLGKYLYPCTQKVFHVKQLHLACGYYSQV
uniref:Topo IA-type catalytic domain-containing protein n=1 Tax=Aegilops tauschii subsp. strangulata TaxID=200361 RepID=A0A452YIL5_AEGTS